MTGSGKGSPQESSPGAPRTALVVFILVTVACVAHALYYYTQVPAEVPQHFGPSGEADAWGSKESSLALHLVMYAVVVATFFGVGMATGKLPDSLINLPNKEHWLSPERREHTMAYMRRQLLWLGSLTMLFLLDLFHQGVRVAMGSERRLGHMWISLGLYLALTAAWAVAYHKRFRRVPQ